MPITGAIATFVVTPITRDYTEAKTLTAGFVVSLAICAYAMVFYHVVRKPLGSERWAASSLTVLFLAPLLLIFRSFPSDNQHLLYSPQPHQILLLHRVKHPQRPLALLFVLGFWGNEKSGGHG